MKGKWIETWIATRSGRWTTAIVLLFLLSPAGRAAVPQEGQVSDQQQDATASPQSEEEFVEIELQTPFGTQRVRVPASSMPQQQQPPEPQPVPPADAPPPPAEPQTVPPADLPQQQEAPAAARLRSPRSGPPLPSRCIWRMPNSCKWSASSRPSFR